MQMAVAAKPQSRKRTTEIKATVSSTQVPNQEKSDEVGLPLFLHHDAVSLFAPQTAPESNFVQRQSTEEANEKLQKKPKYVNVRRQEDEQEELLQRQSLYHDANRPQI